MRWVRRVLAALLMLIVFSGTGQAKAGNIEFTAEEIEFIAQHPVIRLGVDPQFVPYEFFDTDGQYKGIAADYIKLLSQRTGIQMEVKRDLTWTAAYEKAVERELDVLPCVSKTREREQYFLYSEPYYSFQRVIVIPDSDNTVGRLEDLYGKKVAVKKDSSHHSYLKAFNTMEFSLYTTEEAALKAVADGKENYFVGNLATLSYLIKANGYTNLKYIQVSLEEKQYLYFAVRKDWPQLVSIINKGLTSITEEEKIEINNRWIGIENKADYGEIIRIAAIVGAIIGGIFLVSLFWIFKLKREVAERIRAQEELKIAKEEAEVANCIKSSFLARMSHEIRTPLNAITGMAYLIRKTDITATQRIYLDIITQASRNMLGIINDILDFSKIEAGKIELERVSFNLDRVLQQVISIVSFQIEEHGIEFILNKDPLLPVNYFGDPTRLEQVLLNVINNAVKFTTEGKISVGVRLAAEDKDKDVYTLEFSVKDTGIGMSGEQLEKLFSPFDQGDSSINRRFGGTGLGLSIVKSLVEMFGGEISVCSTPGEGSTFNIRLPLEVNREKEEADRQRLSSINLDGIKVLVLEKGAAGSNLLKDYLNSFGMTAEFTTSGDKAMEMLESPAGRGDKPYDLLIVDYDTPGGGGIDFITRMKAEPAIKTKPKTILMIPLMREDLFEKIDENGIDFGIAKPIMASVLYNGIVEIFGDKVVKMRERLSKTHESVDFVVDHPYHVLVIEDNRTNQFIARSILEQAGFRVSLTDDGEMGVQFFKEHQSEIDLILMDLHMPVLNGYEAAGLIRGFDPSIPIVVMTADAVTGVEERCKSVGIDHYISKPFEPEQFVSCIRDALKPLSGETPNIKREEPAIALTEGEVVLDENEGIRLLGNNRDLYRLVLEEYYRENREVYPALAGSIGEGSYQDAIQIVHKIKSSTGNIGARGLFNAAAELQKSLAREDETEIPGMQERFRLAFERLMDEISHRI